MGSVRVFFGCQATDSFVDRESALPMELAAVRDLLGGMLIEEGDYLGLVDSNDRVLQLMLEAGGVVRFDMPIPERQGSYAACLPIGVAMAELGKIAFPLDIPPDERFAFEPY